MGELNSKVILKGYTLDPKHTIAENARICYADDKKFQDIFSGQKIDRIKDKKLIQQLIESKHLSQLEHASFNFFIKGVSRAMTYQLVRHRHASYSQRSQRYVSEKDFDFIIPPSIRDAGLEKRYSQMIEQIGDFYEELGWGLENKLGLKG